MARNYVPTGRPRGRPKKAVYVTPQALEPKTVKLEGPNVPANYIRTVVNRLHTPVSLTPVSKEADNVIRARAALLRSSKEERMQYLAELAQGMGFEHPNSLKAIRERMKIFELLMKGCGDLVPIQLNQQNNFGSELTPPALALLDDGRGWDPNDPATYESDQVIDVPNVGDKEA